MFMYELINGRDVVYIGLTEFTQWAVTGHKNIGNSFTHMNVVSKEQDLEVARASKAERLKLFKQKYGKLPLYNERWKLLDSCAVGHA